MIEITAKPVRADTGIYATGELVECLIEFTLKESETAKENKDSQALAWASGQLHCYRKSATKDNVKEVTELLGKTALDNAKQTIGDVIFETKPKILFCDLTLQPGETKRYFFAETLPRDGPPTYRGYGIRYFYRITIATQRVKSKVQSLVVPIRVLPMPILQRSEDVHFTEETNEELAPTNPFLEKHEPSELEISWHHLKNVTARRAPKYYRISNKRGFVARFCLFKPCYKLGEDIVGSLDFADCTVRCVQFSVKLQLQEIDLHQGVVHASGSSSDLNETSSVNSLDLASVASGSAADNLHKSSTSGSMKINEIDEPTGKISTFTTNHQVCYATLQTHISVPIPLHVTPSFRTDLVDVRWRLHFEFVTTTMMDFGAPSPVTGELKAPAEIPVETMIWDLPITLYAANPLQIYAPSQRHSMTIK